MVPVAIFGNKMIRGIYVVHTVLVIFLCSAHWNLLFVKKVNECEMTYMYEMPQYHMVSYWYMFGNVSED